MSASDIDVERAIADLAREDSGRVLSILARRLGDLDLADEAVQDALVEAALRWPERGIPDKPAAWLMTVAKRKAIDRVRRAASTTRRTEAAAHELHDAHEPSDAGGLAMIDDQGDVEDERLRLVLLCCHPALDRDAQVALTLKLVGGLTTPEIASAFVVPEATLAQRIVRAKRKIRTAQIPMTIPAALDERLDAVLGVFYLVFNEGYLSHSPEADPLRVELTDEAIRLTRVVAALVPDSAEVSGLLALELFLHSRAASRVDGQGDLVLLEDQDRTRWDGETISEANGHLATAMRAMNPGPYQLQALIAAQHANARTAEDTDWALIVSLYGQLDAMVPSPIVTLNHAVALAMADGPDAGLSRLEQVEGLDTYHLFHAARAELLARSGNVEAARDGFAQAIELANSPAERRQLEKRVAQLPND